jgi:hypothetical protein
MTIKQLVETHITALQNERAASVAAHAVYLAEVDDKIQRAQHALTDIDTGPPEVVETLRRLRRLGLLDSIQRDTGP